jgi:hypothetical protein
MYAEVSESKTHPRPSIVLSLTVVVAVAVAVAVVLLRDTKPGYTDRLTALCDHAYDVMREGNGNYFENVVTISSVKHMGLRQLKPPAAQAAFHRELERREFALFESARITQNRVAEASAIPGNAAAVGGAEFPALRAAQAELDGLYRSVGVEHCSD